MPNGVCSKCNEPDVDDTHVCSQLDLFGNPWRRATAECRGILLDLATSLEHGEPLPDLEEVKEVLRRTAGDELPRLYEEDKDAERAKINFTDSDVPASLRWGLTIRAMDEKASHKKYCLTFQVGYQYFVLLRDAEKTTCEFIRDMFLHALSRLSVPISTATLK